MTEVSDEDRSCQRAQERAQRGSADRTLAALKNQAEGLRAEIGRLRQDLAKARRDAGEIPPTLLVEANQQLVLASLHAETIAETAVSNLDELARASQRDVLTGTPNRALMLDRMENAIAVARRHGARVAVLFVDVDDFKQINDTFGHVVGDEVLQQVARCLESAVRESDTVSRHSGDEFLVLLPEVAEASDAALIAERMLSALAALDHVGDRVIPVSVSLGIAIYPEDGQDVATLIARADAAMYRCKRRGRGGFEFYREESLLDGSPSPLENGPQQQAVARHEVTLAQRESRMRDLREANERLVIAALTAQDQKAQVEEARRRQTRFLAMAAHELRNPLAPIRTAAELISRADPRQRLPEQLDIVIKRQVDHMARLVDDLLDESGAITGRFRLECSTAEVADVLGLAIETCFPAMDEKHQQLKMQMPPGSLIVYCDSGRLARVFSNLLDNASRYSPKGGEIGLAAKVLDHHILITVSDNGIGISAEDLPRVFDLFMQGAHAQTRHNPGRGIGLAVVSDLVEAHGGSIVARSAGTDLGSEFVVTLPMANSRGAVCDNR